MHECVQLKRVGYQRRFSQRAGVRAERLDGPDVGKPKPKPDPKGQARPIAPSNGVSPKAGEKEQGGVCLAEDLFTLGPSARYLFAIPGSCEKLNMSRLLHVFVSGAQWWFGVVQLTSFAGLYGTLAPFVH